MQGHTFHHGVIHGENLKPRNHHTNPLGFILLEYIKFDKVAIGMEM